MKICQSCVEWIWEVFGHVTETDPEATHQEIVERDHCEFGPHLAENRILQSFSESRKHEEILKNLQMINLTIELGNTHIGNEDLINYELRDQILEAAKQRIKTILTKNPEKWAESWAKDYTITSSGVATKVTN